MREKIFSLFIVLFLGLVNINAQKTCLSGNCTDGPGVMLNNDGDTTISIFKNGNIGDQVIVAKKNHQAYSLISVGANRWFLEKSGDSLRIGQGAIVNKRLQEDIILLLRKGIFFLRTTSNCCNLLVGKLLKQQLKLLNPKRID
ncbi:MAG: hypothetical protein C0446_04955 [Chitinophaga sp.]|nr:hypothetical protein [Chitinophaga sp.]